MACTPTPFLKWAGGKKQLLSELTGLVPPNFGTYYEPFLGGGALFFRLHSLGRIKRAVLSDASKDLMNCYFAIRDNETNLLSELESLQKHAADRAFFYDFARPEFNKSHLKTGMEGDPRKAALMIYLNKTCFNGLFRVNSKGDFNVPWGRYTNPRIYDVQNIQEARRVLGGANIELRCCDYRLTISKTEGGDFVYFDPPYQPLTSTSSFTSYTPGAFSESEQRNLAETFKELNGKGCMLMMSNSFNPFIEKLYKDYVSKGIVLKIPAKRQISCKGNGRGEINEYVILNYHFA